MANDDSKSLAALIEEGKALHEKTTQGEWRVVPDPKANVLELTAADEHGEFIAISDYPHCGVVAQDIENFAFLAWAHNSLPALVAAVKEREAEIEKLRATRSRLAEMNLAIRRALESVGYKPAADEMGFCLKTTSVVDMVKRMAEWGKTLEGVRNALVKELERIGYTQEQMRELIKPLPAPPAKEGE